MARRGHIRRYDGRGPRLAYANTRIRRYAARRYAGPGENYADTPIRPENTPIRRSRSKYADTPITDPGGKYADTPIRRSDGAMDPGTDGAPLILKSELLPPLISEANTPICRYADPGRKYADTPVRRYAGNTPIRRYADTPIRVPPIWCPVALHDHTALACLPAEKQALASDGN
ncbi:hypothetical protein AK812_SmicGene28884 [Symbiodinium microadriaticum]|uniref:Uncharacterized protein n=1 Tax=Symbiodinium microadriaticum TaxID=2951 RepID=A0A1Q9D370_SYMMI|nr:hypothetical protein AK812_SmicGene28884 [Symbiodinium microadriaticum]